MESLEPLQQGLSQGRVCRVRLCLSTPRYGRKVLEGNSVRKGHWKVKLHCRIFKVDRKGS